MPKLENWNAIFLGIFKHCVMIVFGYYQKFQTKHVLGLVEQCGLVSKKVGPGFCIASGIFPNVVTKKICSSFAFKNRDGLRLVMYFEQKRLGGSRITGLPHKTWLVHLTDCTLYNEMGQPKLEGESSISIPLCTKNQKF